MNLSKAWKVIITYIAPAVIAIAGAYMGERNREEDVQRAADLAVEKMKQEENTEEV